MREDVGAIEGGNVKGGGAELEGLQEHQPSSLDQHFLRDLQGPVGWTHSRRKGQTQPSYTFMECFVEKHPWHTPRPGSSVCHMAQGALLAYHMTIVMTLKGSFLNKIRPLPLAESLFGKCSLGQCIICDAFGLQAGIKKYVDTSPNRLCKSWQAGKNKTKKWQTNKFPYCCWSITLLGNLHNIKQYINAWVMS